MTPIGRVPGIFREAINVLEAALGYKVCSISWEEILEYMSGESPYGDTTTIDDVSSNIYLMIHEIVEICELKARGIEIDRDTVSRIANTPIEKEAHYKASYHELRYAAIKGDCEWIRIRLEHMRDWLEEPGTPEWIIGEYQRLARWLSGLCTRSEGG